MNYLQLINRLRLECGVSGPDLTSLENLSQESRRMAAWIADAWVDVQTEHDDWQFMRREIAFNAVPGQQSYTAADAGIEQTFANWKRDSFTCSSEGQNFGDEDELPFMDYDHFRRMYRFGVARTNEGRPVFMTVTPDKSLALGPVPDQDYLITGDYYARPVRLQAAEDMPLIDERYHMLIVYRAMMSYGTFEAATEVYGRGDMEYRRLRSKLVIDQLPRLVSGAPLA